MTGAASLSVVPRLGAAAVAILESLYQHRLLSTRQIHALHTPNASLRFTQRTLARLRTVELAASVHLPGGLGIWYLTEQGVDAVEAIPNRVETRRKAIPRAHALGPLQAHTLGVNEIGLAFVRAARSRNDDCGFLSWRHEIAFPLTSARTRRADRLITDAVLTYQLNDTSGKTSFHYRFIEFDRGTRASDDLALKIARYARLYRRTVRRDDGEDAVPLWSQHYPVFPTLLVVLAGRHEDALERRRQAVLALCKQDPELEDTPEVEVSIGLLADLQSQGPFASIWRTVADPGRVSNWLGEDCESRSSQ